MAQVAAGLVGLETPCVLIDMDRVEANIARAQAQFDRWGIAFRPHVKTHKLPELARLQLAAGANGLAVQKISEAEVFAAAGFDDLMLCTTLMSPGKIARARALAVGRRFALVADSGAAVAALSGDGAPLRVLVECDTGGGRCGVQSPGEAADLAAMIDAAPGLIFAGLMTYPAAGGTRAVQDFMTEARRQVLARVGHCDIISSGGTPSLDQASGAPVVTEYRAGTYIYNDRSLLERGACRLEDCALMVLATVLSRPTPRRVVLDAGSKILTSDLMGLQGHGFLPAYPKAQITGLSEEHGVVDLGQDAGLPQVGDKVLVIPNHACPVSNLVDRVTLHRAGVVVGGLDVAARGTVI
jgi:D-serine deaminase-like pyridoxal phosphate-dependent protein